MPWVNMGCFNFFSRRDATERPPDLSQFNEHLVQRDAENTDGRKEQISPPPYTETAGCLAKDQSKRDAFGEFRNNACPTQGTIRQWPVGYGEDPLSVCKEWPRCVDDCSTKRFETRTLSSDTQSTDPQSADDHVLTKHLSGRRSPLLDYWHIDEIKPADCTGKLDCCCRQCYNPTYNPTAISQKPDYDSIYVQMVPPAPTITTISPQSMKSSPKFLRDLRAESQADNRNIPHSHRPESYIDIDRPTTQMSGYGIVSTVISPGPFSVHNVDNSRSSPAPTASPVTTFKPRKHCFRPRCPSPVEAPPTSADAPPTSGNAPPTPAKAPLTPDKVRPTSRPSATSTKFVRATNFPPSIAVSHDGEEGFVACQRSIAAQRSAPSEVLHRTVPPNRTICRGTNQR